MAEEPQGMGFVQGHRRVGQQPQQQDGREFQPPKGGHFKSDQVVALRKLGQVHHR